MLWVQSGVFNRCAELFEEAVGRAVVVARGGYGAMMPFAVQALDGYGGEGSGDYAPYMGGMGARRPEGKAGEVDDEDDGGCGPHAHGA